MLTVTCPACSHVSGVDENGFEADCPGCGRTMRAIVCQYHDEPFLAVGERKIRCGLGGCGVIAKTLEEVRRTTFGGEPYEPPLVIRIPYVEVVDGAGWAPELGSEVGLVITDVDLSLLPLAQSPITIPLADVREVRVEGHEVHDNAGVIGGGFGLRGAAIGIAAASLINAIASSTERWVNVTIGAEGGFVGLRLPGKSVMEIRKALRPLADATVSRITPTSAQPKAPTSPVLVAEELGRLADLRDRGVLTEEEFTTAKVRLLGTTG